MRTTNNFSSSNKINSQERVHMNNSNIRNANTQKRTRPHNDLSVTSTHTFIVGIILFENEMLMVNVDWL